MRINLIFVFIMLSVCPLNVYAEVIHPNNGDRISGTIFKEEDKSISIESDAIGIVSIQRSLIRNIETEKVILAQAKKKKV